MESPARPDWATLASTVFVPWSVAVDGAVRGLLDLGQNGAHLRGGLLGLIREALHLLRHHGKAAAVFARLGCLDGGIHGQQIRLRGQVIHAGDDLADGLALLAEANDAFRDRLHLLAGPFGALDHFLHGAAPALRDLRGLLCGAGHDLRLVAGNARRLLDLLHRGGGLGHGGGRLDGAGGKLRGGGQDLAGGRGEHAHGLGYFLDDLAQVAASSSRRPGPAHPARISRWYPRPNSRRRFDSLAPR